MTTPISVGTVGGLIEQMDQATVNALATACGGATQAMDTTAERGRESVALNFRHGNNFIGQGVFANPLWFRRMSSLTYGKCCRLALWKELCGTTSGDYVFLEINPNGEYLYVEQATGLPISRALAEHLHRGRPTMHSLSSANNQTLMQGCQGLQATPENHDRFGAAL